MVKYEEKAKAKYKKLPETRGTVTNGEILKSWGTSKAVRDYNRAVDIKNKQLEEEAKRRKLEEKARKEELEEQIRSEQRRTRLQEQKQALLQQQEIQRKEQARQAALDKKLRENLQKQREINSKQKKSLTDKKYLDSLELTQKRLEREKAKELYPIVEIDGEKYYAEQEVKAAGKRSKLEEKQSIY